MRHQPLFIGSRSSLRAAIAFAALLALAACAPPEPGLTEAEIQAAAAEIMELERQWSAQAAERDTLWIALLHAQDARMMPPNQPPVVGPDAIRSAWGQLVRTEGLSLSWESEEARVARSGDMAWDVGSYTMSLPDGSADRGKYVVVWTREDGEWKVAVDMFSSNQPAPTP